MGGYARFIYSERNTDSARYRGSGGGTGQRTFRNGRRGKQRIRWPDNKPSDWYYLAVQEATNGHNYVRRGTVNEKWTALTGVPDWRRYQ